LDLQFFFNAFSIVLIDLILGGDNAVVIALAVRALPPRERLRGIVIGAGAAVALRVVTTFFAARLLEMRFVQLAGGLLVLWVAIKLFADAEPMESKGAEPHGFWKAISFIVVADITMSTDNVLAIAAASHGSLALLVFGLGLSIPLVVFTSTLLSRLMDRFPLIVYAGAAILGRVGAEMILTDTFVANFWHPSAMTRRMIEAAAAITVVGAGWLVVSRRSAAE
jgi:YjbE family integral membrane protein